MARSWCRRSSGRTSAASSGSPKRASGRTAFAGARATADYASDTGSRWHGKASDFLAGCAVRPGLFCLAWPTLMAYLRIATHPRIFASPLSPAEAEANVDALLALPRVRVLGEGDGFWPAYRALTHLPVRSNLVPDGHLAALLLEHGVSLLHSRDRDFLKFPTLRVEDPFVP